MKTYCYYEQDCEGVLLITEQEIIDKYWDYWYKKMVKKYGVDNELITLDTCILDWCSDNWAEEMVE